MTGDVLIDPLRYALGIGFAAGAGFVAGLLAMWWWVTHEP